MMLSRCQATAVIPASYNDDTLPVSGRDDGPARPCARPASEGSLDESTSRLEGMIPANHDHHTVPLLSYDCGLGMTALAASLSLSITRHKRTVLVVLILLLGLGLSFGLYPGVIAGADPKPDPVEGLWLTQDHGGVVQISRCSAGLCGRIVWIDVTRPRPNGSLPSVGDMAPSINGRVLCGLEILTGFKPVAGTPWIHGTIFNPVDGRTWQGELEVDDTDTLHLRGYVLIPLLGMTHLWTRTRADSITPCRP